MVNPDLVIITGASGLLGANLVLFMGRSGKEVIAIYHNHKFSVPGVRSLQTDLRDKEAVTDIVQRMRPNWIVHCAALTNVDRCEEHPEEAYQVNTEMSRNLAKAASQVNARFLYVSTDSVFDGERGLYSEEDDPLPLNVYGRSKLAGEKAVREESKDSLILRTNIYGWNIQEKESLAEWILNRLESQQPVAGFDDVFFTPILVNDLSEVILDMTERQLTGLYHVTGSQSCSKYEFALRLADIFELRNGLIRPQSVRDSYLKAPRPRNISLKTTKVSQILGRPMPDVMKGLRRFKALRDSGFVVQLKALREERSNAKA